MFKKRGRNMLVIKNLSRSKIKPICLFAHYPTYQMRSSVSSRYLSRKNATPSLTGILSGS